MAFAKKVNGGKLKLSAIDCDEHDSLDKEAGLVKTAELGEEMGELIDMLYFAGQHALLIVLQGRDSSGKDGTIRHLLTYSNAQSTRVVPFKVPTAQELGHDFLWRVHAQAPGKGAIAIFNRSHYEDVLVVRVHSLVPENVWRARYDHINAFESLLVGANTIIVKFFLHIDKKEQEQRLLDREQEAEKAWKLAVGDWKERELWDDYSAAYEEALVRCSTPEAPWYVVAANQKWFRNLAVSERLVETLRPYRKEWMKSLEKLGKTAKAELEAYRKQRG